MCQLSARLQKKHIVGRGSSTVSRNEALDALNRNRLRTDVGHLPIQSVHSLLDAAHRPNGIAVLDRLVATLNAAATEREAQSHYEKTENEPGGERHLQTTLFQSSRQDNSTILTIASRCPCFVVQPLRSL